MKTNNSLSILLILTVLLNLACGGGKSATSDQFDSETAHHQRIAVLRFDSEIKLNQKQCDDVDADELAQLEVEQGKQVQEAVESYLVGRRLRVRVQSSSVTNDELQRAGIDLKIIGDQNVKRLAEILNVDAVVSGYIETEKPMSDALATGLDIAKQLERSLTGTFFGSNINTSTNRGFCRMGLYESNYGDQLWSFQDDIEMSKGSTTEDVIRDLMNKGAKAFPYQK